MLVEHPERFGLSQLHQLRGRVGRGAHRSLCFLLASYARDGERRDEGPALTPALRQRLRRSSGPVTRSVLGAADRSPRASSGISITTTTTRCSAATWVLRTAAVTGGRDASQGGSGS